MSISPRTLPDALVRPGRVATRTALVLLVLFMPRGIGGWFESVQRNRRFIKRSEEKLGGAARNS